MASEPQRKASTHRTKLIRGTHQFDIVGYSQRKHLGSVADKYCFTIIRSGAFSAGGHTWELGCWFDCKGELSSISLELLSLRITKDVVAKASLRIEDPLGESPPAVWRSGSSNVFSISTTATSGMTWKLSVPRAFLAHESSYVRDDRLTIHCTVDLIIEACTPTTEDTPPLCMVPPPTISQDIRKLLLADGPEPDMRPPCLHPDVTFVVEQTEIRAHKLVLAMQSPVFAAQFCWQTNDGAAAARVVIEDMRTSTFRAMLRFIYTDELPIKPTSKHQPACKERYVARRRGAMARDLLVAADRYDVERLRLMCENILSESMDTTNVMATLLVVRGRYSCRQLEDSCIEYIASEFRPCHVRCCDQDTRPHITPRPRMSDRINGLPLGKTWSTYNMSQKVHGVHEFRIPNFLSVQRSHGVGHVIHSGAFHIGGYNWRIEVNPVGDAAENQGNISVYLRLLTDPPDRGVEVSSTFNTTGNWPYPDGQINADGCLYAQNNEGWGLGRLITFESAKSKYLAHDGSLTIHCNVALITHAYTIICSPTTRAMITVPDSSITSQLGKLLVSGDGADVCFLVENSEIHAHHLLIAARSPILCEAMAGAVNIRDDNLIQVDGMKADVFKAMLNFVYTDKLEPLVSTGAAGEMLGAACRFGLDRMKAICQNFLAEHISKDNALHMLKLAHAHCHNCSKLEDYCIEFIRPWPLLAKEREENGGHPSTNRLDLGNL
ncbi:hypothetical protein VPH35_042747 [Triticum aestivum]